MNVFFITRGRREKRRPLGVGQAFFASANIGIREKIGETMGEAMKKKNPLIGISAGVAYPGEDFALRHV